MGTGRRFIPARENRRPKGTEGRVKIIAGLGNPGAKYRNSRHNLGFDVADRLAEDISSGFSREKFDGLLAEGRHAQEKILLVKPQTYMNRSGDCIARVARNKIFDPEDLLVIVDDVNLPLGRMRFRAAGSAGGHNGLRSIIERMGTRDFHRLRLGVGDDRQTGDLADHVLSRFRPGERAAVDELVARAAEAALCWTAQGIVKAMDQYNGS